MLPKVSIGVSVRNGAPHVAECLANLTTQTLQDMEIGVSDNALTDETESLCRAAAAADSRIRYIRQKHDIGSQPNFKLVLNEARGEYFFWRAHDDLCAPDYAEKLARMLDDHPFAALAVGRSTWDNRITGDSRSWEPPDTRGRGTFWRVLLQLNECAPHRIYGMYRHEAAISHQRCVDEQIGHYVFHHDITATARLVMTGRVVTASTTTFIGRRLEAKSFDYAALTHADYRQAVATYSKCVRREFPKLNVGLAARLILFAFTLHLLDRRVVRLERLISSYFRRRTSEHQAGI